MESFSPQIGQHHGGAVAPELDAHHVQLGVVQTEEDGPAPSCRLPAPLLRHDALAHQLPDDP